MPPPAATPVVGGIDGNGEVVVLSGRDVVTAIKVMPGDHSIRGISISTSDGQQYHYGTFGGSRPEEEIVFHEGERIDP